MAPSHLSYGWLDQRMKNRISVLHPLKWVDLSIVLRKEYFLDGKVNHGFPHPPTLPVLRNLLQHPTITSSALDIGG